MSAKIGSKCSLCSLPCPRQPLFDGENPFCCGGCLTVYRILEARCYQGDFRSHPLYQQALSSGILSNPELYQDLSGNEVIGETETLHLEIGEMWCPSCADAIRLILMRKQGIKRCVVDYATDLAVIEFSPLAISKESLFQQIEKLGYRPQSLLSEERKPAISMWIRFVISAFCALNLMMLAFPLYATPVGQTAEGYHEAFGLLSFLLALPLISYCSWPIWRRFFVGVQTGYFGMETLVLIASFTAFCYSTYHFFFHHPEKLYFDSMGMLLTFVLLGKIMERRAKFSAKESLFRATRQLPKKGCKRLSTGEFAYVPIKEIQKGDILLARMGDKIVLDGVVIAGEGLVDASVMTGESIPLYAKPGSQIVGGSLVQQGVLQIQVTKAIEESVLSKISALIEQNLNRKKSGVRFVDRLIPFFVPSVIVLACLAYPFGGLLRTLSVLLISCPCAIGIAAPLVEARLMFRFAKEGALVRNRDSLEVFAKDPLFVFDKTGTLTEGKFEVLSGCDSLTDQGRALIKGITHASTHPLAVALHQHFKDDKPLLPLTEVKEHIGRGMEGHYEGKTYFLGSSAFFQERGLSCPKVQDTAVHFAEKSHYLATLILGDRLRKGIPAVDGCILSGDNPELVSRIAAECGFHWGKGGCDPLQKREEIEKLKQSRPVIMVGDGVNDAPALSAADVGISVVSATDLSIEVSDILLTRDSLASLPELLKIAKKGQRIIRQNIFWAFLYNGVGIGLAMTGLLTPLIAVSAMLLSSICVTLNSQRS